MKSLKAKTGMKLGAASLVVTMALAPLFAQTAAPAAAGNAEKGKALFESASCSACHTLAAAGAMGEVGPSLDKNAHLTHDLIIARVANGQGGMPPYAGQLSPADMEDVAAYVLGAAEK